MQTTQSNAVIIRAVQAAHARYHGSLAEARNDTRAWHKLVAEVARTVREMPLWKLQTIARRDDEFLYPNRRGENVDAIELHAGVAFTLRRFHGLVRELVRGRWLRFVRALPANRSILGESQDLYEFLFGSERGSLETYAEILRGLQSGYCFYCRRGLGANVGQVDHFIPWSRYPVDLGHNFVLAHGRCNDSKSSHLASVEHLERWCERNATVGRLLAESFDRRRLVHNLTASRAIARWAYLQTEQTVSGVWRSTTHGLVELDPTWRSLLTA